MPVVRISDATFADLKSIATWFGTKTPGGTIDHIVRETMDELGLERDVEPEAETGSAGSPAMQFDHTPGLSFTKPLRALVDGAAVAKPNWRNILIATVAAVKAKGVEGEKLARELNIPAKAERYQDDGYTYHAELGISVQGQSATDAWRESERLSRKWRIPVTVEFCWRQNPKAQHPGRTGVLRSGGA